MIGAIVVVGDLTMKNLDLGFWRLVIDAVFYISAVTLTGALDVKAGLALARTAIASRGAAQSAAGEAA